MLQVDLSSCIQKYSLVPFNLSVDLLSNSQNSVYSSKTIRSFKFVNRKTVNPNKHHITCIFNENLRTHFSGGQTSQVEHPGGQIQTLIGVCHHTTKALLLSSFAFLGSLPGDHTIRPHSFPFVLFSICFCLCSLLFQTDARPTCHVVSKPEECQNFLEIS